MIVFASIAAASVLAGIGVATPAAWGSFAIIVGAILGAIGVILLQARPRTALTFSFFLVMLADTKFRSRDATALLTGDIDMQIIFELVMYGVILFALLSVMLHSLHRSGGEVHPTSLELVLLGYVVLALVSILWAPNIRVAAGRSMQLGILYALCFLAARALGPGHLLRCLSLWAVVHTFLFSLMAVVFPWANGTRPSAEASQFAWFAVHPGVVAIFAGTAALMMLAEALFIEAGSRRRIKGMPLWWSVVPLVAILLATHSRTAIFGFAVGAIALVIRKYLRPLTAGWITVIVVSLLAMSLSSMVLSPSTMRSRPEDLPLLTRYLLRGQTVQEFLGLSGRIELWQDVYSLARERPLFGYGYTASRSLLLESFQWAGTAHGALAEVLLNLGVVGAILLWFAFARGLLSAFAKPFLSRGLEAWGQAVVLAGLVFLLIDSLSGEGIAGPASYEVLLFLALTVAQGHLEIMAGSTDSEPRDVHGLTPRLV